MTTGEFIWIAESDDYAHPCFLSEQFRSWNGTQKWDWCLPDRSWLMSAVGAPDSMARIVHALTITSLQGCGKSRITYVAPTESTTSAVSCSGDPPISARGWQDPSMRFCGDWHLYLRLLLIADVAHVTRLLNYCRTHSGSSSHESFRDARYLEEVLRVYNWLSRIARSHTA